MPFRISLIIIGLLCTLYYATLAPLECGDRCPETHTKIIANEYVSPWVYRILMPFLAEFLMRSHVANGVYAAYTILHMFLIPATLLTLFEWLRLFTSPVQAFGACLMFAFFLPFIFLTNYGIGAWSFAEVLFLCLALLLLQSPLRRDVRYVSIAVLTVIASLNRSSAVLIPLAYGILYFDYKKWFDKRLLLEIFILLVLWFMTLTSIRWVRGYSPPMATFPGNIHYSLTGLLPVTIVNNVLILPFWLLAIVRWHYTHPAIKRWAILILFYIFAVFIFGVWNEVRLWMPLFPIALAIIFTSGESPHPLTKSNAE
jgi:hypothetical protein